MRVNRIEYLFWISTRTPPTMTVDSGEEFTVEVSGAFDDVEDISTVATPITPACDGYPLARIPGRLSSAAPSLWRQCRRLLLLVGIWGKPPPRRVVSHFEL